MDCTNIQVTESVRMKQTLDVTTNGDREQMYPKYCPSSYCKHFSNVSKELKFVIQLRMHHIYVNREHLTARQDYWRSFGQSPTETYKKID